MSKIALLGQRLHQRLQRAWQAFRQNADDLHPYVVWVSHANLERRALVEELDRRVDEIRYLSQTVQYFRDRLEEVMDDYYTESKRHATLLSLSDSLRQLQDLQSRLDATLAKV